MRTIIRATLAALLGCVASFANAALLSYSLTALNSTDSPLAFVFIFTGPANVQGLASYAFEGSIALTDLSVPPDGVSVSPFFVPEFWRLEVGDAFSNFTLLDDVGGTAALTGPGPFNFAASGDFDCSALTGGCVFMRLTFASALSADDLLASAATFTLQPRAIAEPATFALLLLALAGLVVVRRRTATASARPPRS